VRVLCTCVSRLAVQSTAVQELPSGLAELDSDMADITQGTLQADCMLGGDEDWALDGISSSRLASLIPSEQEPLSASGQIASSLGINPHTLQVEPTTSRSVMPTALSVGRLHVQSVTSL